MVIPLQMGLSNKILRAKSLKVVDFADPKIRVIVANLKETLASTDDGIGLASPQIGENVRIFVLSPSVGENASGNTVFINPSISKSLRKIELQEGCLSLPKIYGLVKRSKNIKVKAYDETGRKFELRLSGLLAQAVQHEVDHLDGILFIDKTKDLWTIKDKKTDEK